MAQFQRPELDDKQNSELRISVKKDVQDVVTKSTIIVTCY